MTRQQTLIVLGMAVVFALLTGCEKPRPISVQRGYRGTGMEVAYNKPRLDALYAKNQLPEVQAPASPDGPRASEVYQNVQVLGDLSAGEFARVMLAITQWVAPADQSCTYCHQGEMSSDTLYTKVVARRMLQMTRDINSNWKSHVGATGVTCYTCHHGQQVPAQAWFIDPGPPPVHGIVAERNWKNVPAAIVGQSSLPFDPLSPYLLEANDIREQGTTAASGSNHHSIKQAEGTYGLMMYMSNSLGVNCTYCHNTRAFGDWASSPPTRVTAWYGIRMSRALNNNYMVPLTHVLPPDQRGPTGDVGKVGCGTCHRGVYKPLFGQSMLTDYPELAGPRAPPAAATVTDNVTATAAKPL
jgi:photosynthetic reaction center cytochrome c subunit